MSIKIGVIGGSGLSKIGIFESIEEVDIETPFGKPSEKIILGKINKIDIAFLARHGKNHTIPPHKVNYRANIFALKECGVEYIISTAAVGSLKKEIKPLDFVVVNQLIDRTNKRFNTFFDEGVVVHVGFADPFCKVLSDIAYKVIKEQNIRVHKGTYLCIEGPQFSTRAESLLFKSWNVDMIGMTLAAEAKLAREAEICLCAICSVTDYDCWYEGEKDVCVSSVVEVLKKNSIHMANIIKELISRIKYERNCGCHNALENALITPPELIKKYGNAQVNNLLLKRFL